MNKPTPNKSSEIITFFTTLLANPKAALMIVCSSVPAILGAGYIGVTKYNQVITIIETNDAKEQSISDLKTQVATLQKDSVAFKKEMDIVLKSSNDRLNEQMSNLKSKFDAQMESVIKLQDKTSDALMQAREGKVVSESNQKELRSQLISIRAEVNASLDAVRTEIQAMKKATSNPLGG